MDLITTHLNADFDALSSLVAAKKLYPKARLLLPGSQEKAVRNFLALIKDKISIEKEKTCSYEDITRLIIVDNRQRARIGQAGILLDKKDIKVHIYDHHPRSKNDIKGTKDVYKKVGATVTILLGILEKKGKLNLTPLEATLMLLGIYEETGSLSYLMTTKEDVEMVGKLLQLGAKLNAVSSYLNRELSPAELLVFMELVKSAEVVHVNGIETAFAYVDTTNFQGELSTVVHKFQEVENYPLIFVVFESKTKIKLIARSRVEFIDVNKLLSQFSGGGHSSAASAKIINTNYTRLKKEILNVLRKSTLPVVSATDIMSFPVFTIMGNDKVSEVMDKLNQLGYKGAPVLNQKNELVGMVTIGNLKNALNHKMPHAKVKGYITTPVVTASPDAPLHELKRLLIDTHKGRLPIIKNNKLVGIVTRTDILKKVHSALFPPSKSEHIKIMNLKKKMEDRLPLQLLKMIKQIGAVADKKSVNAFLVGGFVRDLILGKKNYDLDLVVEGSAIEFGKVLSRELKGTLVSYERFGTATIFTNWPKWLGPSLHSDNKLKIDIATARKEEYVQPATLPTVEFSSLKEDLYRRDFTINAMAIDINSKNFGLFVDFFGGIQDLKKGFVRILHDNSFIDDPTRIFRAVRFEQRFGFSIEKHSEYLIQHAIKKEMFKWTENQRIREELILILKEKIPENAVIRMRNLHELRFVHPELKLRRDIKILFKRLRRFFKWYNQHSFLRKQFPENWIMNFMLMLDKLDSVQMDDVLNRFVFTRKERAKLENYAEYSKKVIKKLSGKKKMNPGRIYDILEVLSPETLICIMSRTSVRVVQTRIKKYITEYSGIKIKINGLDLIKLGFSPGAEFNDLMKDLLHAKLDKKIVNKRDEIRYLKDILS